MGSAMPSGPSAKLYTRRLFTWAIGGASDDPDTTRSWNVGNREKPVFFTFWETRSVSITSIVSAQGKSPDVKPPRFLEAFS
jgi:hypothetical protein